MRLFIALWPDDSQRRRLMSYRNTLLHQGVSGEPSPEENLHLTLVFIGETDDAKPYQELLKDMPKKHFTLTARGFDAFGRSAHLSYDDNEELSAYVQLLRDRMKSRNLPFDDKPFLPHTTLMKLDDKQDISRITIEKQAMTFHVVGLMQSTLGGKQPVYTPLTLIDG